MYTLYIYIEREREREREKLYDYIYGCSGRTVAWRCPHRSCTISPATFARGVRTVSFQKLNGYLVHTIWCPTESAKLAVEHKSSSESPLIWPTLPSGTQGSSHACSLYGQLSTNHVCFCGLDPGDFKFETVRTHKQHICF